MRLLALFSIAGTLAAGEYAILDTGFRIRAERHEVREGIVRLFTEGGEIEIPAQSVVGFEVEEHVAARQPVAPPEAPPPEAPPDAKALVEQAARKYGLPAELLHSIAAAESGYDPRAVSPKGAIGVMQLMPGTAALLKADPTDMAQNVDAGARHFRDLLEKYDYGLYRALAAYNAGAGAVDRYGWIPPYRETELYVQRVAERYERLSRGKGAGD